MILVTLSVVVTIGAYDAVTPCHLTCVDARCPQRQLPHAGHAQDGALGQESIHRLPAQVSLHRAAAATAAARVRAAAAGEL